MSDNGRVTIADVARHAGVSVATVSKVINDRYGVSPTTGALVRGVIAELGYESSIVARSLRSRRTGVLGILVADFEPFSTELLKGASSALSGTGYELLAYSAGGSGEERVGWERRSLSRLHGTLIDGAILVTPTVVDVQAGVSVVAVDPHTGPSHLPTVDSDNYGGARTATEYLLGLGHRRIGFLGGRQDLESSLLRERGFRDAMAGAGLTVEEDLVQVGDYRREGAHSPALGLLDRPDRPTAVFAANDLSAIGAMDVARELGLELPRDLSVVGFDDVPESAQSTPALTTVAQPIQQMGAEALRILVDVIAGREHPDHVRLQTSLVERSSCAPPR